MKRRKLFFYLEERRRYIELGKWKTINSLSVFGVKKLDRVKRVEKALVDIHPCSHHPLRRRIC
jgi:hypothetical protein